MAVKNGSFDEEYDVVVIGGGIGGLTCGALLARNEKRVKVFERHIIPGGYCTSFERKGFRFDAAVLLLWGYQKGGIIYRILESLGLQDEIDFYELKGIRIILPSETFLLRANTDEFVKMLVERFPAEEAGIKGFFDTAKKLDEDRYKLPALSPTLLKYKDKVASQLQDDYLKDEHLKNLIASIGFAGLTSSRYSAVMKATSLLARVSHPVVSLEGGMQTFPNALARKLKEFGSELELRTAIRKILVENGKAVGVETADGRRVKAGHVVSNVAARQTFLELVGEKELEPEFTERLKNMEICAGGFLVYMGVDLDLKALGITDAVYYVNETDDVEQGYEACLTGDLAKGWFGIYIPSLFNPTICPNLYSANEHVIALFTYAPYDMDWKKEKDRVTELMIGKAERIIPGLSEHIIVKDSASPRTLERYTLNTKGAVVGWAYTPETTLLNTLDQRTPIENLYLVGHWTEPGAGVGRVALSGQMVAEMITHH